MYALGGLSKLRERRKDQDKETGYGDHRATEVMG